VVASTYYPELIVGLDVYTNLVASIHLSKTSILFASTRAQDISLKCASTQEEAFLREASIRRALVLGDIAVWYFVPHSQKPVTPQHHHVDLRVPLPLALYPQQPYHARFYLAPQNYVTNHNRQHPSHLHLQPQLPQPRKTPKEEESIQKLRSRRRRSPQLRVDA
jgi:hypothetical protein